MAVVISDSSPLVHLSAIGRFAVLERLYPNLLIPPAVFQEVAVAGKGRAGAQELEAAIKTGTVRLQSPKAQILSRNELRALDTGEAEALALALEITAELVLIDELRGRAVARTLGLNAIGTLGVIIEAKRQKLLSSVRAELKLLKTRSQLQLTPELEQLVLQLAHEPND
jgi:predicted nucleic acid-binding protein